MKRLSIAENDLRIIKRLKKSLNDKFCLTSYKDIDKAVELANYLVALKNEEEAKSFLESFVHDISYKEDRQDLWGSNGQGIILLAYIYKLEGYSEKENRLIDTIAAHDIVSERTSKYNLYLEDKEDSQEEIEYANTETNKYKCEIIGQQFLTFLYYYEMLPFYEDQGPPTLKDELKQYLDKLLKLLRETLMEA